MTYQVDVWGSIRRSVAANSAIAQASAAQLENARLLYQAELAADYFQIQGLDAARVLLNATVSSYEKYVQLTQNRFDGGGASMGDVALAQTQMETARHGYPRFAHMAKPFLVRGPQLAETLFDAGKRRAQVKLTQAVYDATVASYRQTVLAAFQQVEDSLAVAHPFRRS